MIEQGRWYYSPSWPQLQTPPLMKYIVSPPLFFSLDWTIHSPTTKCLWIAPVADKEHRIMPLCFHR